MKKYRRGYRAEVNLYEDSIDFYLENKEEIERIINQLCEIPCCSFPITQEFYMSSAWKEDENDEY